MGTTSLGVDVMGEEQHLINQPVCVTDFSPEQLMHASYAHMQPPLHVAHLSPRSAVRQMFTQLEPKLK